MKALTREELLVHLKRAIEPLVQKLQPEFVLLFGSFAYGQPHKHSDVDLLIVLPEAPNPDGFSIRIELVQKHLRWSEDVPNCELHIMTSEELRKELLKRNVFVAEVVAKGVPLFSRREWDEVLREVSELMEQSESLYPLNWLQWARDDEERIRGALAFDDVYDATHHLQQVVEEALKAFLLAHGWQLERTHDLLYLLNLATHHLPELSDYEALCQRSNQFVGARYLGVVTPPPSREEIEAWLGQVNRLLEQIAQFVR